MCSPNNQSMWKECRDAILKQYGKVAMSNQSFRLVLKEHGGCMKPTWALPPSLTWR